MGDRKYVGGNVAGIAEFIILIGVDHVIWITMCHAGKKKQF